jgi:CRP-like cAMP-binding protein
MSSYACSAEESVVSTSDRALVAKLHVVDTASLQFVETGEDRSDTWDLGWEVTPAPHERTVTPSTTSDVDHEPEPTPLPPLRDPERDLRPPPQVDLVVPTPRPPPTPLPAVPRVDAASALEELPRVFVGVRPEVLRRVLHHFDVLDIWAGEKIIQQDDVHPALVFLLRGSVEASRDGQGRRVKSGQVLGLTSLYGTGRWPVTLRAVTDCRLMVLELPGYRELRESGSVVALALEEYAIEAMLQGLERTTQRVRELVTPEPIGTVLPNPGMLARFASALGGGGIQPKRLDVVASLLAMPTLRNAEAVDIEVLREHAEGVTAQRGTFLITQGEPSQHLYVIVSGAVDVITAVGSDRAVRYETLGPGDVFGVWSLLRETPNWASYVVTRKAVLVELHKLAWVELASVRGACGSVLRLAVLRGLTRRLTLAGTQVASLQSGRKPIEEVLGDEDHRFTTLQPAGRR